MTIPAEQTAGYWWKRFFTPAGLLGLLLTPFEIYIVVVNSHLLATTLETLLNRPGLPLIPLLLYGWEREITDFDLVGALISIGQMIAASAMHLAWRERHTLQVIFGFALAALLSLITYEVGAAFYRGLVVDGSLANARLSGVFAFGLATLEAAAGIFVIDYFFLPWLLAVLWSIAIPVRAIAHRWARRQGVQARTLRPQRSNSPHPMARAMVYPLAALDRALMAPLRRVDRVVGRVLPDSKYRQGGSSHVESYTLTHPEALPLSDNGRSPTRMRGSERQSAQATDHLDNRA